MSVNPNMHFIPSQNYLPDNVMLTFHPQRGNDNFYDWSKGTENAKREEPGKAYPLNTNDK